MVQNFSADNSWTLANLQPGSYVAAVYALEAQQYQHRDYSQAYSYKAMLNVDSHVSVSVPLSGSAAPHPRCGR